MVIIKGKTYLHNTLGPVIVKGLEGDGYHYVTVLTDSFLRSESGDWRDDWGSRLTCHIGDSVYVKMGSLTEIIPLGKKDKERTPVQLRCKKLWNQSNYIKNNPRQAYS